MEPFLQKKFHIILMELMTKIFLDSGQEEWYNKVSLFELLVVFYLSGEELKESKDLVLTTDCITFKR